LSEQLATGKTEASPKGIFDFNPEVTLARVEIFRKDSRASTTFCCRQNHSAVEVDTVFSAALECERLLTGDPAARLRGPDEHAILDHNNSDADEPVLAFAGSDTQTFRPSQYR
jgi:hypothetical protein